MDATLPRTVRQSLRRRAVDVMLRHGAPPSDVAELGVEQCQRALELPGVPAALRGQLLSFLSVGLDFFGDVSAAERAARDAVDAAPASGDPANEVVTLVPRAAQALANGAWRQAIDLAGEGVARQPPLRASRRCGNFCPTRGRR